MTMPPTADRPVNPWVNLAPYEERDAHLFCGRDAAIATIRQRVLANRITVLIGPSGCGKSSLLRAGLFPALRQAGWLPVAIKLDFDDRSPHGLVQQTIRQIESSVAARSEEYTGLETPDPTIFAEPERQSLWEYLQRMQIWTRGAEFIRPVLIFDQFEEFFSLGSGNPHLASWLRDLSDAFENNRPEAVRRHLETSRASLPFPFVADNAHFVVAIRSDRLALLSEYRNVLPSLVISRNHELLHSFNGEEALEAVLAPPQRAGLPELLDKETARAIVRRIAAHRDSIDDAKDQPLMALTVEPAVLSVECHELFEAKGNAPRITMELLDCSHADILGLFYENAIARQPDRVARFVETRLVEGDVRTPVPLCVARENYSLSDAELTELKHSCLIREERRGEDVFIELTHDVLIAPIQHCARQRHFRSKSRGVAIALALAGVVCGMLFWLIKQQKLITTMQEEKIVGERTIEALQGNAGLVREVASLQRKVESLKAENERVYRTAERLETDLLQLKMQNEQAQSKIDKQDKELLQLKKDNERLLQGEGRQVIGVNDGPPTWLSYGAKLLETAQQYSGEKNKDSQQKEAKVQPVIKVYSGSANTESKNRSISVLGHIRTWFPEGAKLPKTLQQYFHPTDNDSQQRDDTGQEKSEKMTVSGFEKKDMGNNGPQ